MHMISNSAKANHIENDPTAKTAVISCLIGLIAHILLSDPLLNSIGFHYTDEGKFYEKIHPGNFFIFASFVLLIARKSQSLLEMVNVYRSHKIYFSLFLLCIILVIYMSLRSGVGGVAFMVNTHITIAIVAIVLSYASKTVSRNVVIIILAMATINSVVGIVESIGRFRIFTFDPHWVVLGEAYFRASAFMGHPLNNAMFISVVVFITLAAPIKSSVKIALEAIFVVGLVAFGGRAGILYSIAGLLFYGLIILIQLVRARSLNTGQAFLAMASVILTPICLIGGVYILLQSGIGERLATHSHWDESANSRFLALAVFNYTSWEDILFGISSEHIVEIAYRMNLSIPLSDIENPWLLMLLGLGALMFPFWFVVTLLFAWRLMHNQPLAIQLAVLAYYVTASTSNSFGRKDSIYIIMVGAVICVSNLYRRDEEVIALASTG